MILEKRVMVSLRLNSPVSLTVPATEQLPGTESCREGEGHGGRREEQAVILALV